MIIAKVNNKFRKKNEFAKSIPIIKEYLRNFVVAYGIH